jgi:hypothetical protein
MLSLFLRQNSNPNLDKREVRYKPSQWSAALGRSRRG